MTRTIGVPGTGIFYMSRTGTQTRMHSATPPADPARDPAVEALGAVEECPFGHPRGEGQPAAVPLEPALGDAEVDSGPGDNEEMILGEIAPNDGIPVQWRPCFAHDRRPGVEATGGVAGLFLLRCRGATVPSRQGRIPRCPRTGGVISERVCACPPS